MGIAEEFGPTSGELIFLPVGHGDRFRDGGNAVPKLLDKLQSLSDAQLQKI